MQPTVEYATTLDGHRIATFAIGSGEPLLVAAIPPWSHAEQELQIPAAGAWMRDLARHFRVIRYDCRGTGLSDREPIDFATDAQVRDIEAVVRHWGLESFALLGAATGGAASIAYAARHPERASHLILWGAFASGDRFRNRFSVWEGLANLIEKNWPLFTDAFAQAAFGWPESETAARFSQLHRDAMTPEAMLALLGWLPSFDVTREASAIRAPTLLIMRRGGAFYDLAEGRYTTALIPGARLLVLDGAAEVPFLEDPGTVTRAIIDFVASPAEPRAPAPQPVPLTDREQQVLRLLANGHTGKEIAAQLSISVATVQRHIANIYAKIGARGRVDAAAYAFEHGIAARRS